MVSNWEHGLAEVGYALSTLYQNRGVMSEALALLLEDLFHNTLLERLEARCAVENIGSQRVLEKTGFEREGRLRALLQATRPADGQLPLCPPARRLPRRQGGQGSIAGQLGAGLEAGRLHHRGHHVGDAARRRRSPSYCVRSTWSGLMPSRF